MDRLKELKKGAASPEDINVEVDSDRGDCFRLLHAVSECCSEEENTDYLHHI